MIARSIGWGLITLGLAMCAVGVAVEQFWLGSRFGLPPFVDWQTYANAVHRAIDGDSLFAAVQLAGPYELRDAVLVGYAYPPPTVLLFLPFATDPIGLVLWTTVNVGALVTGMFAVVARAWPRRRLEALALLLIVLSLFPPFREGVAVGNVNLMVAGLIAWTWATDGRTPVAMAVAAAGLTKLFPATLVLWPLRTGNPRGTLVALLVGGGLLLVGTLVVGLDAWRDFVVALTNATPSCGEGDYSIACWLREDLGAQVAKAVGVAAWAGLSIVGLVVPIRLIRITLLGVAMILPAADFHSHYWMIVFVLALLVIASLAAPVLRLLWRAALYGRRLVRPGTAVDQGSR